MPALTPEQEDLRAAAKLATESPNAWPHYRNISPPRAILALLAQLEGCNADYGQAVDSVAQLQDEVLEVRAQLEASQAVPDGWRLVPNDQNMTDDQGEAIAKMANCCGGIAYDIYRVALAAAPIFAPGDPAQ